MTPYSIRRVDGAKNSTQLGALHTLTLPLDDHPDYAGGYWWLAKREGEPVAFAGLEWSRTEPESMYLARCGVLSGHRGHGLQRRLLGFRIRFALSQGASSVITTTYDNPPSGNNLIAAGFRLYQPDSPWGSEGTCYWRLALPTPP